MGFPGSPVNSTVNLCWLLSLRTQLRARWDVVPRPMLDAKPQGSAPHCALQAPSSKQFTPLGVKPGRHLISTGSSKVRQCLSGHMLCMQIEPFRVSPLPRPGCPQQGTSIGLKQVGAPTPNQHSHKAPPPLKTAPP